jgi:hypothetical protein
MSERPLYFMKSVRNKVTSVDSWFINDTSSANTSETDGWWDNCELLSRNKVKLHGRDIFQVRIRAFYVGTKGSNKTLH